jgi:DNA polymerase (family 10)
MAKTAKKRGYEYLAITDHSKRVTVAGGLDEKRLREQMEEIESLNETMKNFRILKSIEVDIMEDGTLDLPDSVLKELNLVVCSIHYNFKLSQKKQTDRVLKAMDNPYFNIFSHPTGRIIGKRASYDIDLEAILKKAKKSNCCLEINAQPERLDLSDIHCKIAKDIGVKLSIATDAHTVTDLDFMRFGVAQARMAGGRGCSEYSELARNRAIIKERFLRRTFIFTNKREDYT